jgi:putative hydrolase of the HAD superfamily
MSVQAVIFDFGGTLADGGLDPSSFRRDLYSYLKSVGYYVSMKEIRSAQRSSLNYLMRVRAKNRELSFNEVYTRFLNNLNIPPSRDLLDYLYEIYRRNFKVNLMLGVKGLLKDLSVKYKLAILSNTMSDIPRRFINSEGLSNFFKVIICSSDLGFRKPDAKVFNYVLDKMGVLPKETVFVGDSLEEDMVGAKRVGMTTVWVKGGNENILLNLEYPPDYRIKTIQEILVIIKRIEDD